MTFDSFVQGPFLVLSFVIFASGIIVRLGLSACAVIRNRAGKQTGGRSLPSVFPRFLVPLISIARARPVYFAIRAVFHVSLLVVPVWFSGHITLWEFSDFELSWTAIPDKVADMMTIGIIVLIIYFLGRRIADPHLRSISSLSDYLLLAVTVTPFLSGYLLTHGTVADVPFLGGHMEMLHIFSSEIMLIAIAVLFWRVRLNTDRCIGCAACELACPTGALQYEDSAGRRIFTHHDLPCIACGACVGSCQETAAELGHVLDVSNLWKLFSAQEIGRVDLRVCEACKRFYAPEPQILKVFHGAPPEYGALCPKCRLSSYKDKLVHRPRTAFPFGRKNPGKDAAPDSRKATTS